MDQFNYYGPTGSYDRRNQGRNNSSHYANNSYYPCGSNHPPRYRDRYSNGYRQQQYYRPPYLSNQWHQSGNYWENNVPYHNTPLENIADAQTEMFNDANIYNNEALTYKAIKVAAQMLNTIQLYEDDAGSFATEQNDTNFFKNSVKYHPEHLNPESILKQNCLPMGEVQNKYRTPVANDRNMNQNYNIRKNLLEGFSQPVESSKAQRMMQKMGWQGGALGVKGEGLTEPIVPNLFQLNRAGLGLSNETEAPPESPPRQVHHPDTVRRSTMKRAAALKDLKEDIFSRLLDFVRDSRRTEIVFDSAFCKRERKVIHQLVQHVREMSVTGGRLKLSEDAAVMQEIWDCNKYALYTHSDGVYPDRKLTLYKEAPEGVYLITPYDLRNCVDDDENWEEADEDDEETGEASQSNSYVSKKYSARSRNKLSTRVEYVPTNNINFKNKHNKNELKSNDDDENLDSGSALNTEILHIDSENPHADAISPIIDLTPVETEISNVNSEISQDGEKNSNMESDIAHVDCEIPRAINEVINNSVDSSKAIVDSNSPLVNTKIPIVDLEEDDSSKDLLKDIEKTNKNLVADVNSVLPHSNAENILEGVRNTQVEPTLNQNANDLNTQTDAEMQYVKIENALNTDTQHMDTHVNTKNRLVHPDNRAKVEHETPEMKLDDAVSINKLKILSEWKKWQKSDEILYLHKEKHDAKDNDTDALKETTEKMSKNDEPLTKKEIHELLMKYLKEFLDDEVCTEMRFLGEFDDTEQEAIAEFLKDVAKCVENSDPGETMEHCQLKDIVKTDSVLNVSEDCNGDPVITKTRKPSNSEIILIE